MRISILVLFFTIIATSLAKAEKLTVLGLNIGMSYEEMTSELEQRDYKCEKLIDDNRHRGWNCSKDTAFIMIWKRPKTIIFSCGSFKGCHLSTDELIVYIEDAFKFTSKMNLDKMYGYCALGLDGDKLCLTDIGFGGQSIQLHESPKPTF